MEHPVACPVVRSSLWPRTEVLPAAEAFDSGFWISNSNLFRFSILGFRISGLVVAERHLRISDFRFWLWPNATLGTDTP